MNGPVARGRSEDGQVVRLSSGDSQIRVKSQKYSELDIDGRETCLTFLVHPLDLKAKLRKLI